MFVDKFFLADENDLNPTVEFPNGPDVQLPLVPDEQKVELEPMGFTAPNGVFQPGGLYHLTVSGNWNTSRTDYAYSYDNTNWHPLAGMQIICGSGNDIYFETDESYFYIRANDTAGAFANNTPNTAPFPTWTLAMGEQTEAVTCSDKFSYDVQDDMLISGTIQGNDADGVIPEVELTIGDWYAIETAGDPWYENGSPRYDIGIFAGATSGLHTSAFTTELSVWQYTDCVEDTGTASHKRYYFQAPNPNILLRVNDQDNNFTNNTGQIGYNLYHVDMIRYFRAGCERIFTVNPDPFWSQHVDAQAAAGVMLYPLQYVIVEDFKEFMAEDYFVLGQWYMLQTRDGPWLDGPAVASWMMEYSDDDGETWSPYSNLTWSVCSVQIDPVGHTRIYFRAEVADEDGLVSKYKDYKVRVLDTTDDYVNNSGSMNFDVFQATNDQVQTSPGAEYLEGACGGFYTQGEQQSDVGVNPKRSTGIYVPALIEENYYSIETRGYWTDNGVGKLHIAEISDDDGVTWYAWNEFPTKLCVESFFDEYDEVQFRLYFKAEAGSKFKVRAETSDANWNNNTDGTLDNNGSGPFGIKVFDAQALVDPWNKCGADYPIVPIKTQEVLYAHLGGQSSPSDASCLDLVPGQLYAIEPTIGQWYDGGDPAAPLDAKYDYQLSFDDGVTWYSWNDTTMPGYLCVMRGPYYARVYFNAANENTYARIRVLDRDGDFTNNTGQMIYTIYALNSVSDPDLTNYVSPSATVGCARWATRPSFFPNVTKPTAPAAITSLGDIGPWFDYVGAWLGWVRNSMPDLGAWLEYMRVSFMRFFLWCPEHTAGVTSILLDIRTLEPFKTIARIQRQQEAIERQLESYKWEMDETPAVPFSEGGGTDIPSLIPSFSNSPYSGSGTPFTYTPLEGGGLTDSLSCSGHLVLAMGDSPMAQGFCTVMGFLKITGLYVTVNIGIVLAAILVSIRYVFKHWILFFTKLINHSG